MVSGNRPVESLSSQLGLVWMEVVGGGQSAGEVRPWNH